MHRLAYSADPASAAAPTEPLLTEKLIAISHVKHAAEEGMTRAKLEEMREGIERDIWKFRELLGDAPLRHRPNRSRAAAVASVS